ncbi:MAG: ABC transporter permease [Caldilineales bacterium]|nr:ABC transporter permease [Caldilineales bacterium]MCW5859738.1 ABC transporter permease [Caldilineales bacterium]
MHNILLVMKNEITTTINRRSFWLMTFVFPLFIIGLALLPQILAGNELSDDPQTVFTRSLSAPSGFIDASGLLRQPAPGVPEQQFRRFEDETAAKAAVASGLIDHYYLIPPDFLASGEVTQVARQFSIFSSIGGAPVLDYVAAYNLLGDANLAGRALHPLATVVSEDLAPQEGRKDESTASGPFAYLAPFVAMFILFFIITMSAGFMLQSVAKEKENRTAEVLLLSLNPKQLMFGKVFGLSLVALFQMAVWLGGSRVALGRWAPAAGIAGGLAYSTGMIAAILIYFLLGYLLYASILGALGALAPTMREGAQFTFIVMLPLLLPIWLNNAFTANPDGGLALIFSLFPLTAPTAMVARLTITQVPAWQLAVSLAGLLATTDGFILLSARFFRADTLLSNASLSFRSIVQQARQAMK